MRKVFDEVNRYEPSYLESRGLIKQAKTKAGGYPTYICPLCGNGTGETGDGMTITNPSGRYYYKCHKCGTGLSNADLFGVVELGLSKEELKTTAGQAQIAKGLEDFFNIENEYTGKKQTAAAKQKSSLSFKGEKDPAQAKVAHHDGITKRDASSGGNLPSQVASGRQAQQAEKDFSELYTKARAQLPAFIEGAGGNWRGLKLDTLSRFGCGYLPNWHAEKSTVESPRVIIPSSKGSYLARLTTDAQSLPKKQHQGTKYPFNFDGIQTDEPNYIVEGAIDAMSIMQATGFIYQCIATGGAGETTSLIDALAKRYGAAKKKPQFVILFDNDDAGQRGSVKLSEVLNSLGFLTVATFLSKEKEADANEILQCADGTQTLANLFIDVAVDKAGQELEERAAAVQTVGGGVGFGDYFANYYEKDVAEMIPFAERTTGFEYLDEAQMFSAGVYVLGGLSAVGKTTYAWQLLEQLADKGESCIYCSYEMSRLQMFTKSLARYIFQKSGRRLSVSSSILAKGKGRDSDFYKQAKKDFATSNKRLQVLELQNENIDEILERLKRFCAENEKPPVICIDYLQIIPCNEGYTKKEQVDAVIRKIKVFQRVTASTVILISSLNRASYKVSATFESFKESGGVEYTADVVFALQLNAVHAAEKAMKSGKENLNVAGMIERAKKATPREIELVCLKNRFGKNYSLCYRYYPAADCFVECPQGEFDKKRANEI